MGDDHGWDETAYNGHPHLKTPVLDEMAATGLRLDRFYSAHPTCSPTRGSFLTGRHPNRYGTFSPGWAIRPQEISVATIMDKAGYHAGHFGKWHLGPVKADSPTNPGKMGFHEWLSHDNFFEMNPFLSRNGGPPEKHEGEGSEIMINETIRFISKARKQNKPFFAVVWFGSPHEPYSGLEKDLALYDNLPEQYRKRQVRLTSNETGRPILRRLDKVLRERYAEITAMDRSIGTLRKYLKDEGLRENTLLWYCGDNGVPSSGNAAMTLRGLKGTMYEGGLRVPGIIEWPAQIAKPMISSVNTVTSDLLPTLCDLVGQSLPDRPLDGVSLKPLFAGEMTERPSPVCFWSYPIASLRARKPKSWFKPDELEGTTPLVKMLDGRFTRHFENYHQPEITETDFGGPRSILDNRYKLIMEADGKTSRMLFDLRDDPAEKINLIKDKPEVAGKLERQLRDWQQSVLNSLSGADYRE
jgi:arylsulfatase A-like enzyme